MEQRAEPVERDVEDNSPRVSEFARDLNTEDRCDACGAQAFVRVLLRTGELLFCVHHFNKNENTLESIAIAITDQRERIEELV